MTNHRNTEGMYAPPHPRGQSAAELYREACIDQARVMRGFAATLRDAIDRLAPVARIATPDVRVDAELAKVASIESALLSIAAGLDAGSAR